MGLLDAGSLDRAATLFQNLVRIEGGGGFTLQLMIACQPETIGRARARSGDESLLYVLPFNLKGKSCFRTCWGVYPSKQAAIDSIPRLPRAYSEAGLKPIVVSMARLQSPG